MPPIEQSDLSECYHHSTILLTAQLEQEEKERSQVEHSISSLQKDMVRLSALITEKRGQQEKLEQGNIIMENDFIHALKVHVITTTLFDNIIARNCRRLS